MQPNEAKEILGLSGEPSATEIIEAYHRLSKKYHPDIYATHEETIRQVMQEKFVQLGRAKEVLLQALSAEGRGGQTGGENLSQGLIKLETWPIRVGSINAKSPGFVPSITSGSPS